MTDDRVQPLVEECQRQEESCLYMSTTLFEWLKELRLWRGAFVITPIAAGGVASWQLIADAPAMKIVVGVCALVAAVMPAVYKALDFDVSLDLLRTQAHAFKVLQDRFRQAWRVTALGDSNAFKEEFDGLMSRMDEVRSASLTAPDRLFEKARKKIERGDYAFRADAKQAGGTLSKQSGAQS